MSSGALDDFSRAELVRKARQFSQSPSDWIEKLSPYTAPALGLKFDPVKADKPLIALAVKFCRQHSLAEISRRRIALLVSEIREDLL